MSEDMFDRAEKVVFAERPTIKQLTRGGVRRDATYAADTPDAKTVKNCEGRTLILFPKSVERNKPSRFEGNDPADRWTVDVVVLDGETITEKLDKDGDVTAEFETPLVPPFLIPNMYISNKMLGAQLDGRKKVLAQLMVLPPLAKGGNKSYALGDFSPEAYETAVKWMNDHPVDEFDV